MSTPANDRPTELPDLSLVPVKKAEVEDARCGACDAFQPIHPQRKVGQCRMDPPSPLLVGVANGPLGQQPIVDGFFPLVGASHWCKRFELRTGEPRPVLTHHGDMQTVGPKQ